MLSGCPTKSLNAILRTTRESARLWISRSPLRAATTMSAMASERFSPDEDSVGVGIGVDDLPDVMRDLFEQCVADARAAVDPADDFDAFVDELWRQTSAAFGLVRRDWLHNAPQPWPALLEEQRGVAEAVLEGRLNPQGLEP